LLADPRRNAIEEQVVVVAVHSKRRVAANHASATMYTGHRRILVFWSGSHSDSLGR
jgi:hypothetical protein